MHYCPMCGINLQNGFAFCPRCGAEIGTEQARYAGALSGPVDCRFPLPEKENGTDAGLGYDADEKKGKYRSTLRLEELEEEFEVLPAVYSPRKRGPVGKDYVPAWKDPDPDTEPAVVPYRDLDRDRGGFGWWLLGFLLPLAGLAVYLCSREELPGRARSVGSGALSCLILLSATVGTAAVMVMSGHLLLR